MNCPLESRQSQQLLDYTSGLMAPAENAAMERHIEGCAACREFVKGQLAVWAALDNWESVPVSADFDRRLFERIENDVPWWRRVLRPLTAYRGVPAAAAACLLITAGILIERPRPAVQPNPEVALVDVQPEQIEQALDAMDALGDFSHKAGTEGTNSKL